MISLYLAEKTWLHRVPAGIKLIGLAGLSLVLFPVQNWMILAAILGVCLAVYCLLGSGSRKQLIILKTMWPVLAVIFLAHAWLQTWEGGLAAVLRLSVMILIANLVTMTTTMDAMLETLKPVLMPLRFLGIPYERLALAVALVIRFIPVLHGQWLTLEEAHRARTGRKAGFRLIGPFCINTLRLADRVGESLDARGVGVKRQGR